MLIMPERENDESREDMVRAHVMSINPPAMALVVILHGDNSREKAIFRSIESETTVRQNIGRMFTVLVFANGGDGENSPAMLFKATICEGRSRGFERA
jgi:hypothetical protein